MIQAVRSSSNASSFFRSRLVEPFRQKLVGPKSKYRHQKRYEQSHATGETLESRTLLAGTGTNYVVTTNVDVIDPADGELSFREALLAANSNAAFGDAPAGSADGDCITFDAALDGMIMEIDSSLGGFVIADDITIEFPGSNIIFDGTDGAGSVRIFDVTTTEQISLNDLTLQEGIADDGGALRIITGGMVDITNVSFFDNEATGAGATNGGGAIYSSAAQLNITDSFLNGNSAWGTSGSGGGIFIAEGDVTVTGTEIRNNEAARAGGGIEIVDGTLVLDDVDLLSNFVDGFVIPANPGNGGGLHVSGMMGTRVEVMNSNVAGNIAAQEGGGLWNQSGSVMLVTNTTFDGNSAQGADADMGGGAIFNNGGLLRVTDSTFTDNLAILGALGSGGAIMTTAGSVRITNSTFTGNEASRAGGALEIIEGNVRINGSTFGGMGVDDANTAGINGGAIHLTGVAMPAQVSNLVITAGSQIIGNSAGSEGGGLWNAATTTLVVTGGTVVSDNIASGDDATNGGGGIFNDGGNVNVLDATVTNNMANGTAGSGGGIMTVDGKLRVTNSVLTGNSAERAGGAIEVIEGDVRITDSTLGGFGMGDANTAGINGGAVHVTGDAMAMDGTLVQVSGSQVIGNTAESEGGGLWNAVNSTMTVFRNSVVSDNIASGVNADNGGGGIFNDGGTLNVLDSTVEFNSADGTLGSGGGIMSIAGEVDITRTLMRGNSAERAGGAVEVIEGNVRIDNSVLGGTLVNDANTAGINGGAVHLTGVAMPTAVSNVVVTGGSMIIGNTAESEGGGLWNAATTSLIVSGGVEISGNIANGGDATNGGGGIFNDGGAVSVTGSTVTDNMAAGRFGSGGGLMSVAGTVRVTNSTMTGNTAERAGGAIEIIEGDVRITGSTLGGTGMGEANTAGINGGAVHVTGVAMPATTTRILVSNTDVIGNTAASEGGGLWNAATTRLVVADRSVVSDNVASGAEATNGGGGIFNDGGTLIVRDTTIEDNTADGAAGSGGGIFSVAGPVTVNNTTISGNSAERAGGGIEFGTTNATLNNVTFENNNANINGGGIHITGDMATMSSIIIDGGTFRGNTAASEGGGVWNAANSMMTIRNRSFFSNNTASGSAVDNGGGAIFNNGGTMVVRDTTVTGNTANGNMGSGGGLLNVDMGDVDVINSIFQDNFAQSLGGGLSNQGDVVNLNNSTITQNQAGISGGGVHTGTGATTNVNGSTVISNNTPDDQATV